MTAGLSAVNLANAWLNTMRNTSAATFTAPTDLYIQCHTADPGASGTTAVSTGIATRTIADWNAASAGSMALTATVSFTATGGDTGTFPLPEFAKERATNPEAFASSTKLRK